MNLATRRIWQLLTATDAAGRAVIFMTPSRRNFAEYTIEQEFVSRVFLHECTHAFCSIYECAAYSSCLIFFHGQRHYTILTSASFMIVLVLPSSSLDRTLVLDGNDLSRPESSEAGVHLVD